MTLWRTFGRWLHVLLLSGIVAGTTHARTPEDDAIVFGRMESVNWSALLIRVSGHDYRVSGSTLMSWQNGTRADLQSLQPGLQVEMQIDPAHSSSGIPLVRSLMLQLD